MLLESRLFVIDGFLEFGMTLSQATFLWNGLLFLVILCVTYLLRQVFRQFFLGVIRRFSLKTASQFDDIVLAHGVFDVLPTVVALTALYLLSGWLLLESPLLLLLSQKVAILGMIFAVYRSANRFVNALVEISKSSKALKDKPVTSYGQVLKILNLFVATILTLSIVLDKSPMVFLSGLGALTAVLLLVFKDTIMGFVASIQLSANDLVRPGDWIEMPKYGADGTVLDVSLTSVKVQNWDKTISTFPVVSLISDSFKNWRGMQESGARRIKRLLYIDVTSIAFLDAKTLKQLSKIDLISDYLAQKTEDIKADNKDAGVDAKSVPMNGRCLSNVGTFRAYIEAYLRSRPDIYTKELTFLVRQLPVSPEGLPIEIYVFSKVQDWVQYEGIQSDIFDHLLSMMPLFGLRAFQYSNSLQK